MGERTYQRHEAGGFLAKYLPGHIFSGTYGADAALAKAEELLKVSRWNFPYRFWNKALTPEEEGRHHMLFAVACHVLARRPLSGEQELHWTYNGDGLGINLPYHLSGRR